MKKDFMFTAALLACTVSVLSTACVTTAEAVFPEFDTSGTITQTLIYDQDGINITARDLTYDDSTAVLTLLFSNGSDKDLEFVAGSFGFNENAINGYIIPDGFIDSDVPAGKKVTEEMEFDLDQLQLYGINYIADLQVGFTIEDTENNCIYTDVIDIPTSIADKFNPETADDTFQSMIVDDAVQEDFEYTFVSYVTDEPAEWDTLTLLSKGLYIDQSGDMCVMLEVKNKGADIKSMEINGITVNGLVLNNFTLVPTVITPNNTAIITQSIDNFLTSEEEAELGMDAISTVDLDLNIMSGIYESDITNATISMSDSNTTSSYNDQGTELYNENGIRVITAGNPYKEENDDDEIYTAFIIQNTSGYTIEADYSYDTLSVNDFMIDGRGDDCGLDDGESGVYIMTLPREDLEKNNITSVEDIEKIEFTLRISSDQFDERKEATITANY